MVTTTLLSVVEIYPSQHFFRRFSQAKQNWPVKDHKIKTFLTVAKLYNFTGVEIKFAN